jgi:hypothetical protein
MNQKAFPVKEDYEEGWREGVNDKCPQVTDTASS